MFKFFIFRSFLAFEAKKIEAGFVRTHGTIAATAVAWAIINWVTRTRDVGAVCPLKIIGIHGQPIWILPVILGLVIVRFIKVGDVSMAIYAYRTVFVIPYRISLLVMPFAVF